MRTGSKGYLAKDTAVNAYVTDDKGQPTRVKITLPAGSMFQTSGVEMTPEQAQRPSDAPKD